MRAVRFRRLPHFILDCVKINSDGSMHVFVFQWKKGIPVEVIPMAYVPVMKRMEKLGLKPVLRMAKAKAVSIPYRQCQLALMRYRTKDYRQIRVTVTRMKISFL